MKRIFFIIFLNYILKQSFIHSSPTFDVSKLKVSKETDQIMIVIPYSYSAHNGRFYYYIKKEDGKWHEIINTKSNIGQNGLGKEKEGDRKTPIGKFNFTKYFGIADDPGTKMQYWKVNESIWWNCDSNKKEYNTMVNTEYYKEEFSHEDSEHIIDYTKAYVYAMNINYNAERIGKKGCAIFLHCFTDNNFTAGCVAISEKDMKKVMTNVNENAIIIIDELKNIYNY